MDLETDRGRPFRRGQPTDAAATGAASSSGSGAPGASAAAEAAGLAAGVLPLRASTVSLQSMDDWGDLDVPGVRLEEPDWLRDLVSQAAAEKRESLNGSEEAAHTPERK